jgi:hypothetical protein
MQEYPADMLRDHIRLSEWVMELSRYYGTGIQIRVIDPQSGLGFFKSLRHRVRRYPTFIINGKVKYTGWDKEAMGNLLRDASSG